MSELWTLEWEDDGYDGDWLDPDEKVEASEDAEMAMEGYDLD
jgi:hypothetical protein